jgi:glycosyltransferase involved in cell wall biosynthesis
VTAPLVSILTPSLNQGRFLRDCVRSVEVQTYPRIEHVVCDGGSQDETVGILAASSDRMSWVSEPDRGQADAVNKAFEASSGEIIGWINSDDALFATTTVEKVVSIFARHPELAGVYGDVAILSEDGRILRHARSRWPSGARLRRGSSPVSQPSLFLRRTAIGDSPLLREDLHVVLDLELVLRLARRAVSVRHAGCVLVADRDHGARKVRTLTGAYNAELRELAAQYGIEFTDDLRDKVFAFVNRLAGVPSVCSWSRYPFAGPWHVDGLPSRVWRQLTTRHLRLLDDAAARAHGDRYGG